MKELLTALTAVSVGTTTTVFLSKGSAVDFGVASAIGIAIMIAIVFAPHLFISISRNMTRKPD